MSAGEPDPRGGSHEADKGKIPGGVSEPEKEANPDVLLDVPVLKVEEIDLELKDLRAHISLRADLADFVSVNVGVDAYLDEVKLKVKGVEAQVLLKVSLDRVLDTFNRALDVMDRNPEVLAHGLRKDLHHLKEDTEPSATRSAGKASPETVGLTHESTVVFETTDGEGNPVIRSVDGFGTLTETVLDNSGAVTDETVVGNVEDLPIEREYTDGDGRTIRRVRDDLGNLLERILDARGDTLQVNVPEAGGDEDEDLAIEITPAAEKKARDLGVDLSSVTGTGVGGRILVRDVEEVAA